MNIDEINTYNEFSVCLFNKTKEEYGGLSNMAGGFPLPVNQTPFLTSEALYQVCRFPDFPDIQLKIVQQKSPMSAKMVGKHHKSDTRDDWNEVRVDVMRWSLRVKLGHHFIKFGRLLTSTSGLQIVEESHNDRFWGTVRKRGDHQILVGQNVLGKLLMEMREDYLMGKFEELLLIHPPEIDNFRILGRDQETIDFRRKLKNIERHHREYPREVIV